MTYTGRLAQAYSRAGRPVSSPPPEAAKRWRFPSPDGRIARMSTSELFRFPEAARRDPEVDRWMEVQEGDLGSIARDWFDHIRTQGDDVRELLHDDHPTACVEDAAFAYVDAFRAHVNVGFYRGALLPDPKQILEGTGKRMRHVKLRPGIEIDTAALERLITAAYEDMRACLADDPPERKP